MAKKSLVVKPVVPTKSNRSAAQKVKVASSNLFILDLPADNTDLMADAIIEDIGAQEIINLTRTDLLNGQNVEYNVLQNLESTQRQFNANELIKLQQTDDEYFNSFVLNLNNFTPEYGTGEYVNNSDVRTSSGEIVFVDIDTGNLVINTVNMSNNLVLEVEFVSYSEISSTDV